MNGQFEQWFEDMESRYAASYDSYKELLQEAFEAGAAKATDKANKAWTSFCIKMVNAEREACAKVWKTDTATIQTYPSHLVKLECAPTTSEQEVKHE